VLFFYFVPDTTRDFTDFKDLHGLSSMDVVKATNRLIALTPEINCDLTAMGLPPVTSAVFFIAN
jgi:hypothetical protein